MKIQKRQISDIFVVGGFLILGIMASPPHQLISAVWLLVAFGILQLISAKLYRSTVRSSQAQLTSVNDEFSKSSQHWKELHDFQELRVHQLKNLLQHNNITSGESL